MPVFTILPRILMNAAGAEQASGAGGGGALAASSAATPTAAAQAPAPAATSQPDPSWINDRIAQAKNSATTETLKALGVASLDDAKAKLDALKKLEDEKKSDNERQAEKIKSLEKDAARKKELEESVAKFADGLMKSLTDAQRESVKKIAGDDPAKVVAAIEALAPTWTAPTAQAATGQATSGTAAAAPPVSTAPAVGAPPPAGGGQTETPLQAWNRLRASNPFAASAHYLQHQAEIDKERFRPKA